MVRGSDPARLGTKDIAWAFGIYTTWTLVTYLLEGRLHTLLRPQAVLDRLVYAVVANLIIGVVITGIFLRYATRLRVRTSADYGFRSANRTGLSLLIGCILGTVVFVLQRPPSLDPMVLVNGFAQVWVVSVAEILVCWVVLGSTILAVGARVGRRTALIGAWLVSAVSFGVYHFAHSPPFQSLQMVSVLTIVGLVTGAFFYTMREVYGTLVFHNFLALKGVTQALADSGRLDEFRSLQWPLIVTGLTSLVLLVAIDRFVVRGERKRAAAGSP